MPQTVVKAQHRTPRGRRRQFVVLTPVVAAVVGLVGGVWWLTSPDALRGPGAWASPAVEDGDVVVVGYTGTIREEVQIADAAPIVVGDLEIDAELQVCVSAEGESGVGLVAEEDISEFCEHVEPAWGASLAPDREPDARGTLMASVQVHGEGVGALCGWEVTYRAGMQRGTQRHVGSQRLMLDTTHPNHATQEVAEELVASCDEA